MILDMILVSVIISALVIICWVHFGKDPNTGKEFSFRFRICTCWICLTIMGIVNILYYVYKPEQAILNLIIGIICFLEVSTEAVLVVFRLDKELEESEE